MNKKDVLVIFKTHLDVGFTNYAENVIDNYLNSFIPNAIKVGYELKDTDTPFRWTVGSWMIWKALKEDKSGVVEKAVRDGILNWHGLPFTTHTELLNAKLFEAGLDISTELDEKFGRKTIAAKMTDVPGHTIGMVPLMRKRGLEFLHIGVNSATPVPPVPPLFKWKNGDEYITVMYEDGYGCTQEFDDFVLCFAHTHDNCGPQSKEEIIKVYEEIQKKFPGYTLKAATLNDVAERVRNIKNIPVIEKEIGDTWIHGAATDPKKLSRYRNILRHTDENDLCDLRLRESLLLVPEHTWGMDVKKYFRDNKHYTYKQMEDCVDERKTIEKSWEEQRNYVCNAEKILKIEPDYDTSAPDLSGYEKITDDKADVFDISWQIFDNGDYERYKKDYMRLNEATVGWAIWDFTKVGLPDYNGGIYTAQVTEAYKKDNTEIYKLEFNKEIETKYGLPYFYLIINGKNIEIKWYNKKNSRLPQACWFKIKGLDEEWELNKIGKWISPENIIGSPLISAVENGVRNNSVVIETIDSALVAPYGRRLLHYNDEGLKQDLYFNLYNNIWNTNFPMWYSDDAVFRFVIKER